jgi:hypothetical protein
MKPHTPLSAFDALGTIAAMMALSCLAILLTVIA